MGWEHDNNSVPSEWSAMITSSLSNVKNLNRHNDTTTWAFCFEIFGRLGDIARHGHFVNASHQ